jgi:hypothetical protein
MTILEFAAAVVPSLAWPTAAVILAILLRPALVDLLSRVRFATFKSARVEFDRRISRVLKQLPEDGIALAKTRPAVSGDWPPQAMVMFAWQQVEGALLRLAKAANLEVKDETSLTNIIVALRMRGLLDPSTTDALNEMYDLKNIAAHAGYIDATQADKYWDAASRIEEELNNLTRQLK